MAEKKEVRERAILLVRSAVEAHVTAARMGVGNYQEEWKWVLSVLAGEGVPDTIGGEPNNLPGECQFCNAGERPREVRRKVLRICDGCTDDLVTGGSA